MTDYPGRRWRPSNGTEMDSFVGHHCENCARDIGNQCTILSRAFAEPVEEWRIVDDLSMCTAFVPVGEPLPDDAAALEAAGQERLF